MNKIAAFLTFILVIAWAYTSWYWYTCNIKGLCNNNVVLSQNEDGSIGTITGESTETVGEDSDQNTILAEETSGDTDVSGTGMLSSEDVSENEYSEVSQDDETEEVSEDDSEDTTLKNESFVSSGTTSENDSGENTGEESQNTEIPESEENNSVATLCETPLVGPIAYGAENNTEEVKRLEKFLQSQGADIEIDGVYKSDDFEAVKAFQLKYRADILDPWDIATPTGYVYKTTVKKINEIACQ